MRVRLLVFSALCAVAIAACGGGGGGPTPTMPTPFVPTPTPIPTNADARPAAAGDTFAYAGSTTTTFVRPPQINGVIPSPNPTNSQTLAYTTTQSQSVLANQTYNGVTTAFGFTTNEMDTLFGGLSSLQTTSTEYYNYVANGGTTQVRDLGGTAKTSTGVSYATLLGAGNGLVDILPETPGTLLPGNDAALMRSQTNADGSTDARTTASNGTYTESLAYVGGSTARAVANADGSGSFSFPLGPPTNALFEVSAPATPVAPSTGSPAIAITITYPAGLQVTPNTTPTPTIVKRSVGVWYPLPLVLSTQSIVDQGPTALPAACNVPTNVPRAGTFATVATTATIDPVFGEMDTRTATTYTASGIGIACLQMQDVLVQYYDFSEQTGQFVATRSTPVQTTTTTQLLGLTSENVIGTSSVARAPAFVAASRASFELRLDRARNARHAAALRTMRASAAVMESR